MRKWLARNLVALAQRIRPESPEVMQFYLDIMHDQLITGRSVVRVNPMDIQEEQSK